MAENETLLLEPAVDPDAPPAEIADYVDDEVDVLWQVNSIDSAEWALSRISDMEAEIAENDRILQLHIAALKLKTDALNKKAERKKAYFTWQIKRWAEMNKPLLLKGGRKKSRNLLHGVIGWKQEGGGLEVVDPDALLAWAQKQPVEWGLVRITEEPAIKAIKKWVMDGDGDPTQFPPGLKVGQSKDEFYIRAQSQAPKQEEQHVDAAE